jgi:pilin isopeptide linkage protein
MSSGVSPFYFTLTESTGGTSTTGTWNNSTTEYLIRVEISKAGDGSITGYKMRTSADDTWDSRGDFIAADPFGTNTDRAKFENTYTPEGTSWTPEAVKTTEGASMTASQFSFELWEADSSGVALGSGPVRTATTTLGNLTSQTVLFDSIALTTTDTKYYVLKEVKGTDGGWEYSDIQHFITVTVINEGGSLKPDSITYRSRKGDTGTLSDPIDFDAVKPAFKNTYETTPTSWTPRAVKLAFGRLMDDGHFNFTLYDSDVDGKLGAERQTVTNGEGDVSMVIFSAIDYDTADTTHYYLIHEASDFGHGWVTDDHYYHFKVYVRDNGDGTMTPEVSYRSKNGIEGNWSGWTTYDADDPMSWPWFRNDHYMLEALMVIAVEKRITGIDSTDQTFNFTLTEMIKDGEDFIEKPDGYTATLINIKADQIGYIPLPEVYEVGTYYYRITEDDDQIEGWNYDKNEFIVTVVVYHDPVNPSILDYEVHYPDEQFPIVFTNTFQNHEFRFIKTDRHDSAINGVAFELYAYQYDDAGNPPAGHEDHAELITGNDDCCWVLHDTTISGSDPDAVFGEVTFGGLLAGDYMLVETATLSTLALPSGQWLIRITINGNIDILARGDALPPAFKYDPETGQYRLPNYPKIEVPRVGTSTALIATTTGAVLISLIGLKGMTVLRKKEDELTVKE